MACVNVKYTRVGGDIRVTFSEICGTSVGESFLFDKDGRMLLDKQGQYLQLKKR